MTPPRPYFRGFEGIEHLLVAGDDPATATPELDASNWPPIASTAMLAIVVFIPWYLLKRRKKPLTSCYPYLKTPSICKISVGNAVADRSNVNVASTSCLEATKEGDRVSTLLSATNELGSQAACVDKLVEQTDSVPYASPMPRATDQPNNVDSDNCWSASHIWPPGVLLCFADC